MSAPARPILRWHGGKWMLAPWILSHFPAHQVYVEPFGGAGSVLMRKQRAYAEIWNDLDDEVVNLFVVVRHPKSAIALKNALSLTPFARSEFRIAYERVEEPVERARRLIVRSFMGFGSTGTNFQKTGFRSNSNRSGSTPAHDWRNYPAAMDAFVERLRGVVIENKNAIELMRQHDAPTTLHYVDPPYVHETRNLGNQYCVKHKYAHELSDADHRELLVFLDDLEGMVVLSGYPTPFYDQLLSKWHRVERVALADGARRRIEVLWINQSAWSKLQDREMLLFEVAN
ncbi:DNA adenine methylase [Hoeflea sp. TYP-13]|uniref:DNA adenine methylase n=1 Tax=Hoeflea sp. TYP-13 TaxID=3230023 RepID=UPI0034C6A342